MNYAHRGRNAQKRWKLLPVEGDIGITTLWILLVKCAVACVEILCDELYCTLIRWIKFRFNASKWSCHECAAGTYNPKKVHRRRCQLVSCGRSLDFAMFYFYWTLIWNDKTITDRTGDTIRARHHLRHWRYFSFVMTLTFLSKETKEFNDMGIYFHNTDCRTGT